jgi:hypothetical protein
VSVIDRWGSTVSGWSGVVQAFERAKEGGADRGVGGGPPEAGELFRADPAHLSALAGDWRAAGGRGRQKEPEIEYRTFMAAAEV